MDRYAALEALVLLHFRGVRVELIQPPMSYCLVFELPLAACQKELPGVRVLVEV